MVMNLLLLTACSSTAATRAPQNTGPVVQQPVETSPTTVTASTQTFQGAPTSSSAVLAQMRAGARGPFTATYRFIGGPYDETTTVTRDAAGNVRIMVSKRGNRAFEAVSVGGKVFVRMFNSDASSLARVGVPSTEWFAYDKWVELVRVLAVSNTMYEALLSEFADVAGLLATESPLSLVFGEQFVPPLKSCYTPASGPIKNQVTETEAGRWLVKCETDLGVITPFTVTFDKNGQLASFRDGDEEDATEYIQRHVLEVSYAPVDDIVEPDTAWFDSHEESVRLSLVLIGELAFPCSEVCA